MPVPYAHPVDVLRRFDPSLDAEDFQSGTGELLGGGDLNDIWARLASVSQDWDTDTGTALRERRTGSPGAPRTYEHQDANRSQGFPLRVELDHDDIVPLDPAEDDVFEIRTGRDNWEDITSEEGDEWVLLHDSGDLKIFDLLVRRVWWEAPDERYLRASYRYGALGGDPQRGGQTTLASSATDTATTLSVEDASRLPGEGGIVLITSPSPKGMTGEYVAVTGIDHGADELTVSRGRRRTPKEPHDEGDTVHYCPMDIRDAVAAQAAAELVKSDLSLQRTDSDDAAISPSRKLDDWADEYESAKAQYSAVRRM